MNSRAEDVLQSKLGAILAGEETMDAPLSGDRDQ